MTITKVKKRDGRIVDFDKNKITEAIFASAKSVGGKDRELAGRIASQVETVISVFFKDESSIPSVEQIQDLVEKILIENGHAKTAKAFILYRQLHAEERAQKTEILGIETDKNFSLNAVKILEQGFLLKDENGHVIETPEQMLRRTAHAIAAVDQNYKNFFTTESEEKFYKMMLQKDFLPSSPILMNAGTKNAKLAACYVLPVSDSIPEIFDTLKNAAIIQQTGGGTGFNFSHLRPRGDRVKSTGGISSGPVSFIEVFNSMTTAMKAGGKRRGANMAILNVNHPDILEFITSKEKETSIQNFNLSIGLTEKFMEAVEKNEEYDLINPATGKKVSTLNAHSVFELIVAKAWTNGEPGIIFLDRIERDNPTPTLGKLESVNPCGEQPLLANEACNLGSVNLSNFVTEKNSIDWEKLSYTVHEAIHFLDNVIDAGEYPLPETEKLVKGNRKIGLGVMGFADLLYKLSIAYDSEEGLNMAEQIMSFIQKEARAASIYLGEKKGSFPNFDISIYPQKGYKSLRNATVTTIAPTGTISLLADTVSGIEPLFALSYTKQITDGAEISYTNKTFVNALVKSGLYSKEIIKKVNKHGTIQGLDEIPEELKKVFVVAGDITPQWHVKMQAIFQRNTDNAVSKTVNFPGNAEIGDIRKTYLLAYKLGCKGITIYRDQSRESQPLGAGRSPLQTDSSPEYNPAQVSLPLIFESKPAPKNRHRGIQEIIPPPIKSQT